MFGTKFIPDTLPGVVLNARSTMDFCLGVLQLTSPAVAFPRAGGLCRQEGKVSPVLSCHVSASTFLRSEEPFVVAGLF